MALVLHVVEQAIPVFKLLGAVDAEAQVHLSPDEVDQLDLEIGRMASFRKCR